MLTDCPPNKHYSGSLMTVSLLNLLLTYNFCCYVVVDPKLDYKEFDETIYNIPKRIHNKTKETNVSLFDYYLNKFINLPKIAKDIIKFAKQNQIDCIWSILQGQNIVCLTDILIKKSGLPVKVQIWDSFEWWLRVRKIKPVLQKKYLEIFDQVILGADAIATASDNMVAEYRKKYHRDSQAILSFLDNKSYDNLSQNTFLNDDVLLIGFCGQLYAKNNFLSLFNALNQINWQVGNKKIKLRLMTYIKNINDLRSYFDNIDIKDENVELLGWVKTNEVIKLLSECDLLYCPFWFDEEFKLEAETSFPSKLTTYLAVNRPILMHAPEYSSPYSFLKKYNAALFCKYLSTGSLAATMEQLNNKYLISQIMENANNAFKENLVPSVTKKKMEKFLSISNKI